MIHAVGRPGYDEEAFGWKSSPSGIGDANDEWGTRIPPDAPLSIAINDGTASSVSAADRGDHPAPSTADVNLPVPVQASPKPEC
ncbi:MAG: hypothetical protein L7S64_10160, partial [Longimicrobiales bacterium]|nr:hypothetical protein [Longimicrobiales bacterium]